MQEKLDVVHRVIADWTKGVEDEMAARAGVIATANAELAKKLHAAKGNALKEQKKYLREKRLYEGNVLPSNRSKFDAAIRARRHAQEIVTKLEKAKMMIASLQRDDETRQAEITVQNNKIAPLWTALHDKVMRGESWDGADEANYKKIIQAEDVIRDIHTQILKNKHRIAYCQRLAATYDAAHPERYEGQWLNIANAIVEQQDIFGFQGEIQRRGAETNTAGSGLEGYAAVAQGALLKKGDVVRYSMPSRKILIEQDHTGRIVDKTPPSVNQQDKILAAIKTAQLLLLDRVQRAEKKIYLQASQEYLPQVKLIVAALIVQAKQGGVALKLADLSIEVPGWTDWLGSENTSISESKKLQTDIITVIGHHHAQDDLKEKIRSIKGKTLLVDEPVYQPRKI